MSTVQASDRRFYLLGDVHIEEARSGKVITLPRSLRGLLGYLLVYRHRYHPREILAEQLWSEHDPPRSRANLNTALWRLRSLVEPKNSASGPYLVESAMNEIKF